MGDFRLTVSIFATVKWKSCNGKFTAKVNFSDRTYNVTIIDADIGSLKSLHTLFDKYLDHMLVKFEKKNRMIRMYKFLSFWGKMVNHI